MLEDFENEEDQLSAENAPEPVPVVRRLRETDSGRRARRSAPIRGYVGANGGGKTLAMVHDTLPSLDSGRRVLSTVEFIDFRTGLPFPNYERLEDWSQVMDCRETDIVFDEIVGVAGARAHGSLPVEVQNLLVQLRRRDNTLAWSAPSWTRADLIIRETSQAVTVCRGYLGKRARDAEGKALLWSQKRLFRWKTYDAVNFEEFTAQKATKLKADHKAWFRGVGSRAMHSYDTFDDVSRVGAAIDSGRCASCGGVRRPKPCTCGKHQVVLSSNVDRELVNTTTGELLGVVEPPTTRDR